MCACFTFCDAQHKNNNNVRADFACLFKPCIVFSRDCHIADTPEAHFQYHKLHLNWYQQVLRAQNIFEMMFFYLEQFLANKMVSKQTQQEAQKQN